MQKIRENKEAGNDEIHVISSFPASLFLQGSLSRKLFFCLSVKAAYRIAGSTDRVDLHLRIDFF